MKSTGRRTGDDGSYWITYPDGSEVRVYGPQGACVMSQEQVFAEFQRANAHDQSVFLRLKMRCAQRTAEL